MSRTYEEAMKVLRGELPLAEGIPAKQLFTIDELTDLVKSVSGVVDVVRFEQGRMASVRLVKRMLRKNAVSGVFMEWLYANCHSFQPTFFLEAKMAFVNERMTWNGTTSRKSNDALSLVIIYAPAPAR